MSEQVSSFEKVRVGDFNYLFFVVSWNDYQTAVRDEVWRQLNAFGKELGTKGLVVQSYPEQLWTTAKEIKAKSWPQEFGERLKEELDPFMLIISVDFEAFDPQRDPWSIIWFSDYNNYASDVAHLFHRLALMCGENQDILRYISEVARRKRIAKTARGVRSLMEFFEFKPGVFGISIDVKALVENIADAGIDAIEQVG
jgi:hypothetical protein